MNDYQFENKPKRKLYHYTLVLPIYFIIIVITLSFTLFFTKSKEYSIELKIIICSIYYTCITMVIISHSIAMVTDNTFFPCQSDTEICKKCQLPKPPRAHHCKLCGVCIKRMDHHCPWIVNCVGENNHKCFILLLLYSLICCAISSITLSKPFKFILTHQSEINNSIVVDTLLEQLLVSIYFTLPIIGFILATIVSLMLVVLITSQFQFLMYNLTMIEWKTYPKKADSPYYNNNFKQNYCELFGYDIIWWFVPFNYMYNQPPKEYRTINNQEPFSDVI